MFLAIKLYACKPEYCLSLARTMFFTLPRLPLLQCFKFNVTFSSESSHLKKVFN